MKARAAWLLLFLAFECASAAPSSDPKHLHFAESEVCSRLLAPMLHGQLTYRARFALDDLTATPETSTEALKGMVSDWLAANFPKIRDVNAIIANPTGVMIHQSGLDIASITHQTKREESSLEHWVLAIESSSQNGARWRLELGISTQFSSKRITFNAQIISWMLDRDRRMNLQSGLASLVRKVIGAQTLWRPTTGSLALPANRPVALSAAPNEIELLRQILTSRDRRLPIVYVSIQPQTLTYPINPDQLAGDLSGVAIVLKEDSLEAQHMMHQVVPSAFQTPVGGLRIYQPRVNFADLGDQARHRSMTNFEIASSHDEFREGLISQVILSVDHRRSSAEVATLSDIIHLELKGLARQLKNQTTPQTADGDEGLYRDLIGILEGEQVQLKAQIEQLQAELDSTVGEWQTTIEEFAELRRLHARPTPPSPAVARKSLVKGTGHVVAGRDFLVNDVVVDPPVFPTQLPKNLVEVAETFAKSFLGRLVFTERALASVRKTAFDNPQVAWRIFYHMGTTLHHLYFEENVNPNSIPDLFLKRTGFELAPHESSSVLQNSRLRKLRDDTYQGRTIHIGAHVKFGKHPKIFRVHYYVDREHHLIVIGHAGDHLESTSDRFH